MENILQIAYEVKLPLADMDLIKEYLDHNEWGIAFELLCSAIEQENIKINDNQYKIICKLGNKMGFDEELWSSIKVI